ncbi:MAG: hypothetical protein LBK94_07795 [Prevotellaceae bacterium]|jgi:hypothetical protein|nr:hypothetical protein [Prevotellaceae bacterium]
MKSIKNFRNSNGELHAGESRKNRKPNHSHKGNSQKKRFIEEFDDGDDLNFDCKKRESIEDYFDDDDET